MTTKPNSGPIVLVTRSHDRESRLGESLERATDRTVHSIPLTALDLEDDVNSDGPQHRETDFDATTGGAGHDTSGIETQSTVESNDGLRQFLTPNSATDLTPLAQSPAALVFELTTPERLRAMLRAVEERTSSIPTVVAPHRGVKHWRQSQFGRTLTSTSPPTATRR